MRPLLLLALAAILGATFTAIVLNALQQRDAYARGLMQVMQHDYGVLRQSLRTRNCSAEPTRKALARLRELADGIETAIYGNAAADAPFAEYERRLLETLDPARADASTDCKALTPKIDAIANACDACHRQYR